MAMEEVDDDDDKSLYICSNQDPDYRYVIHAIKWRDLLSFSGNSNDLRKVAASELDADVPYFMGCGCLGSEILFAGGLDNFGTYVFETAGTTHVDVIKYQSCFGEFQDSKPQAILFEVYGNLYALSGWPDPLRWDSHSPDYWPLSFEKFDRTTATWLALPDLKLKPFSFLAKDEFSSYLSHAVAGTKIMVSGPLNPVVCFDVAAANDLRNQEWTPLSFMFCGGFFPFRDRALVLDLEDADNEHIMFSYHLIAAKGWAIVAYHMFNDSVQKIQALQPSCLPTRFQGRLKHRFAHLGGPKFCLVIANFTSKEECKTRILLPTFEFSFSKRDTASFSAKILGCRTFECDWPHGQSHESGLNLTDLLGSFLL